MTATASTGDTGGTGGTGHVFRRLDDARAAHRPCPPVRRLLPPGDLDAAYAEQSAWVAGREAAGARVVGRKIGLTNPKVRAQLGVDQPDFGVLLDDMASREGEPIDTARLLQPKIEAEVAFVLARDLDLDSDVIGPAEVVAATSHVLAALEIVDSRIADWDISIVDSVADNASSGLFVLGSRPRTLDGLDLSSCAMEMRRGDEVVSTGTGADCMGDPVRAVAWLATTARDRGRPLRAGEVILSGALGPMVAVTSGDEFQAGITRGTTCGPEAERSLLAAVLASVSLHRPVAPRRRAHDAFEGVAEGALGAIAPACRDRRDGAVTGPQLPCRRTDTPAHEVLQGRYADPLREPGGELGPRHSDLRGELRDGPAVRRHVVHESQRGPDLAIGEGGEPDAAVRAAFGAARRDMGPEQVDQQDVRQPLRDERGAQPGRIGLRTEQFERGPDGVRGTGPGVDVDERRKDVDEHRGVGLVEVESAAHHDRVPGRPDPDGGPLGEFREDLGARHRRHGLAAGQLEGPAVPDQVAVALGERHGPREPGHRDPARASQNGTELDVPVAREADRPGLLRLKPRELGDTQVE